jgi:hypothetical protein
MARDLRTGFAFPFRRAAGWAHGPVEVKLKLSTHIHLLSMRLDSAVSAPPN